MWGNCSKWWKYWQNSRSIKKGISKINFENNRFKDEHGQTAAIMAGLNYCTNDIIIIMDPDLQNDPDDIPNLIKKLMRDMMLFQDGEK